MATTIPSAITGPHLAGPPRHLHRRRLRRRSRPVASTNVRTRLAGPGQADHGTSRDHYAARGPPLWPAADGLVSTRELLRVWMSGCHLARSGRPGIPPTSAWRRRDLGPGSPRPGALWRPGLECAPGPVAAACRPR